MCDFLFVIFGCNFWEFVYIIFVCSCCMYLLYVCMGGWMDEWMDVCMYVM